MLLWLNIFLILFILVTSILLDMSEHSGFLTEHLVSSVHLLSPNIHGVNSYATMSRIFQAALSGQQSPITIFAVSMPYSLLYLLNLPEIVVPKDNAEFSLSIMR